jgi:organic radical activating enzyme
MNLTKIISTRNYDELEIVFWPTDICNFNCPYCFPGSTEGKWRYSDVDLALKTFKEIFDRYKKRKYNLFIAGGGEPTLWPKLEYFCEKVKELANCRIVLISNGSRTLRWWEDNAKFIDEAVLSCHVQDVNIDHFINVADTLYERGTEVLGLMLMDAQEWNRCVEYINKMLDSRLPWNVQAKEVVSSPGRDIDSYTQEQMDFLRDPIKRFTISKDLSQYNYVQSLGFYNDKQFTATANTYIMNKQNYFKGWKCNMPLERIAVDAGLNVKASCGVKFDKLEAVICTKDCCDCQPDTHITKWKV